MHPRENSKNIIIIIIDWIKLKKKVTSLTRLFDFLTRLVIYLGQNGNRILWKVVRIVNWIPYCRPFLCDTASITNSSARSQQDLDEGQLIFHANQCYGSAQKLYERYFRDMSSGIWPGFYGISPDLGEGCFSRKPFDSSHCWLYHGLSLNTRQRLLYGCRDRHEDKNCVHLLREVVWCIDSGGVQQVL